VFDRRTGEPVWPWEDREVPQTDVPGEWTAPTQPFPTKPPPFDVQGIGPDDLIDFTPALRAEALEAIEEFTHRPNLYTPPSRGGRPTIAARSSCPASAAAPTGSRARRSRRPASSTSARHEPDRHRAPSRTTRRSSGFDSDYVMGGGARCRPCRACGC
jgi:glucose dehydrogenase